MDFDSLPVEILPYICRHFRAEDRRNVRLTCRLWYDECSRSDVIEKEKFVFRKRENRDCTQHYSAGLQSTCQTWRTWFEFHGLHLPAFSPDVWRACGSRIRFLFLYNCDIDENTFVDIVLFCENLVQFYFESLVHNLIRSAPVKLFCVQNPITPKLDELIMSRTVRKKLISFEAYFGNNRFRVSWLMYVKILKIFPCIRSFGHRGSVHGRSPPSQRYTLSDDEVNQPTTWPFPVSEGSIGRQPWPWDWLPVKFKEFKTLFFDSGFYRPYQYAFIDYQTELENLYLLVVPVPNSDHDGLAVLFHALNKLPKLKELQYDTMPYRNTSHFLTAGLFGKFLQLSRNLETLLLEYALLNLKLAAAGELRSLPSVRYTRLKTLLLGRNIEERIIFEILSRCSRTVQFLRLDAPINREIIQKIFKKHTGLQFLKVVNLEPIFRGDDTYVSDPVPLEYSCNKLQNLKRLEIESIMSYPYFRGFWSDFNSPDLRYFQFPWSNFPSRATPENIHQIVGETLRVLIEKAPLLEILSFYKNVPLSAIELANYCRQLTKLEVILITEGSWKEWVDRDRGGVERLFMECRSLRWLAGRESPSMYSYDHFSRELIEYSENICQFDQKYNICASCDPNYPLL